MGLAAIYPTGSWEISVFEPMIAGAFEMGAFRVPKDNADDPCYISDHTDIGIGMNAATKYPEAARIFLDWVASAEFASLYANNMVGFFPLANIEYSVENPTVKEFLSWRSECESSIRISASIIGRGEPGMDTDLWNTSANVINGTMTPADAAAYVQEALAKWYKPQQ
jgi:raffinose/stachyose/melibiose transport system substrate-binding protein